MDYKEIIPKIIDEYEQNIKENGTSVNLSEYLSKELEEIEKTIREIAAAKKSIEKLSNRFNQELEIENTFIRKKQLNCKHWKTIYHPDPSGNNDSSYTCLICGLEKRKF